MTGLPKYTFFIKTSENELHVKNTLTPTNKGELGLDFF